MKVVYNLGPPPRAVASEAHLSWYAMFAVAPLYVDTGIRGVAVTVNGCNSVYARMHCRSGFVCRLIYEGSVIICSPWRQIWRDVAVAFGRYMKNNMVSKHKPHRDKSQI